jgi:hypothetical protein
MLARRTWWTAALVLTLLALPAAGAAQTANPSEGAPSSPEKLPAPHVTSPLPGIKMDFANPVFTWEPVPEAAAYIVEICKDAGCATPVDRVVLSDLARIAQEPEWRPQALPVGTHYWRVTARSRSGQDGEPTPAGSLEITSDRLDHEPPVAKLGVVGRQVKVAGRLFTAPGIGLELAADDAGCGLLRSAPLVNDSPDTPGDHQVSGYALDRCGNRVTVPPLAFTVDAEAPTVRSTVVERDVEPKAAGHAEVPGKTGLYWSADGRRWLPLWRPGKAKARASRKNEITGGQPRLLLAARGVQLSIDGQTVAPGPGQLLAITAEDAGAGVERLRFRAAGGPGGAPTLEIAAVDRVGNTREVAWPLVVPGRP